MNDTDYSFNSQDYEVTIRLYNGINDVYLTNTAWDDLFLEDDIFNIFFRGSIIINTPYDSLERNPTEADIMTNASKENLVYKFRNDGRDTLYISIKPKNTELAILGGESIDLSDKRWLLELETVIYDVKDMMHGNPTNKRKQLFFWEKTFQMMIERDSEFSTANTGEHIGKPNQDQVSDTDRSQPTGNALASLLLLYPEFAKHAELVTDPEEWDTGSSEALIYHTSPINAKFYDDLTYLYNVHVSTDAYNNQPCILKLERSENKSLPKQFSLKPIQKYMEKAGKAPTSPGEYQNEHYFIQENSYSNENKIPSIVKAPLEKGVINEFKADEFSIIKQYQLVDLVGGDYYKNLCNRRLASFNASNGQFNIDSVEHKAEKWKDFYKDSISPFILTRDTKDRLPLTPYIESGFNTTVEATILPTGIGRRSIGINKLIKYYLFSNLAISFATKGLTFRQPGRFFGLSKQTFNDKEFDHKLEGQYFVTQVIHHFSNTNRSYFTQMIGVKTHVFQSDTTFNSDDLILISEGDGSSDESKTSSPETPPPPAPTRRPNIPAPPILRTPSINIEYPTFPTTFTP